MIRKLKRRLADSSLRTKYAAAIFLLLVFTFISGSYLLTRNYKSASDSMYQDVLSDMKDIYQEVSRFEKRLTHLCTILQNDDTAISMMKNMRELKNIQAFENNRQSITPGLYALLDGSGDYDCRLYVRARLDFINASSRIQLLPDPTEEPWVEKAMAGWGWRQFMTAEELNASFPALLGPMRDTEHLQDLIGLLRIDIRTEALKRMLTPVRTGQYVSCYIETPSEQTVAQSGIPLTRLDYLAHLTKSDRTGFDSVRLHEISGKTEHLLYQRLPHSDWMLVMVFHRDLLTSHILSSQAGVILGTVLMILAGMLCAIPILWHAVHRIRRFHTYVQKYNDANLSEIPPRLEPMAHDEIGELIESHNAMLDHIQTLMQEKSAQEEEMRRLEIFALQAQIKPHFLYNTLEAIGWMSRLNMPEKVDSTIRSLTAFYRLCLSSGKDILPLDRELEIVRNYFAVACMRYDDQYTLEINVREETLGILLPKLTLQPLVENALMHGLMESGQEGGTIRIFTRKSPEGGWELCIADSGAHFSQQAWTRILRNPESFGGDGYGLKNVERRLCLYYGREDVMRLDISEPGWSIIVIPLK